MPDTTNHLANDIRDINDVYEQDPDLARRYVQKLAERVEQSDASTELTATFGLEPEQEIRARAAEIVGPPPVTDANAMVAWDGAVVTLAAYIRDGSRP